MRLKLAWFESLLQTQQKFIEKARFSKVLHFRRQGMPDSHPLEQAQAQLVGQLAQLGHTGSIRWHIRTRLGTLASPSASLEKHSR